MASCNLNGGTITCRLRGLVEGRAEGRLLTVNGPLSFYGEVNPEDCRLHDGRQLERNVILVFRESRGSTVAPYIIYSLRSRGCGPAGMVVVRAEPMLVAGAVMGEIPLAAELPEEILGMLRDGSPSILVSNPPNATLKIQLRG